MDFDFSDEQLLIKQTAREFAEEELAPDIEERDKNQTFPYRQFKKLAELGFMGVIVPEKYGGAGMDMMSLVLIIEEISRIDPSVGVVLSVHNSLTCGGILEFGTEEQKKKYLEPLATGVGIGAYSISEPEAGSDIAGIRTRYKFDGNHFILNGTKMWVTSGNSASYYILFATKDPDLRHSGISAFIIEKTFSGFKVGKKENKLGIRSSDTCELVLEDCYVPEENILGKEGDGFKIAVILLNSGRIGIAAQAIGIAQACLESSVKYAQERKQFGRKIASFQAIQNKIADMATEIDAGRFLLYRAAMKKEKGEDCAVEASMAKYFCSQVAVKSSIQAVQIHGGYGYLKDFPVERYMRDAKITEIYEGTTEIQRLVIARNLLKSK
ncbi:acyl-CoA dehydrogenase [candidate division KSB1 bacterium]|nr:MAG: acyl-CoA dehydrogenase [candidate division KSB1 bacterium]